MVQVVVLGGGPAALALAAACGEHGVDTVVIGGPDAPWSPNYGLWVDEADRLGVGGYLGATWRDSDLVLSDDEVVPLGRAYARVARRRLRASLLDRCARSGVRVRWARAGAVSHHVGRSVVTCDDGVDAEGVVVVDATGHRPIAVRRPAEPRAFQAAVGVRISPREHPWAEDRFVFMDWRPADDEALTDGPPSFLYVMPFGPADVFVEETSLVHAPAVPFQLLRDRLRRRLRRMGVAAEAARESELCLIPMDTPLPDLRQRTLGFGAAASMVHPATGYQLARALATAPRLAASLADGLRRGRSPEQLARGGWQTIWPAPARLGREIFQFGAEFVASLDARELASFFRAFAGLPPRLRDGYLAGDVRLAASLGAMVGTLARCPASLRARLARSGLGLPQRLVRGAAFVGSGKGEPECP